MSKEPKWVTEVQKEIKRLEKRIKKLERLIEKDEHNSYTWEDLDNWEGWLAALKWCLRMRDGTATRKDAWGKKG